MPRISVRNAVISRDRPSAISFFNSLAQANQRLGNLGHGGVGTLRFAAVLLRTQRLAADGFRTLGRLLTDGLRAQGIGAQAVWARIFVADWLTAIDLAAQLLAERRGNRQLAAGLYRVLECGALEWGNAALVIGTRLRTGGGAFPDGIAFPDSIAVPRCRECALALHDFRDRIGNGDRTIRRDPSPLIASSRSHQSFDARFQALDRAVSARRETTCRHRTGRQDVEYLIAIRSSFFASFIGP